MTTDDEEIDLRRLAEEAAREAYSPRAQHCWPWSHRWTMWEPNGRSDVSTASLRPMRQDRREAGVLTSAKGYYRTITSSCIGATIARPGRSDGKAPMSRVQ